MALESKKSIFLSSYAYPKLSSRESRGCVWGEGVLVVVRCYVIHVPQ